jgi:hypothetical protein
VIHDLIQPVSQILAWSGSDSLVSRREIMP